MKRVAAALLLCGCWSFDAARRACEDAGACAFGGSGGGGAGGGAMPPDAGPEFAVDCRGGWCDELPFPTSSALYSVWSDDTVTWVCGASGLILSLENGVWKKWPTSETAPLHSIVRDATGRVTAVGDAVCEKAPAAAVFNCTMPVAFASLYTVWAAPDGGRLAGGDVGDPLLLEARGGAFTRVPLNAMTGAINHVGGSSWDDVWAAGDDGQLYAASGARLPHDAGTNVDFVGSCLDGLGTRWVLGANPASICVYAAGELTCRAGMLVAPSHLACLPGGGVLYSSQSERQLRRCPADGGACFDFVQLGRNVREIFVAGNSTWVAGNDGQLAFWDGGGFTEVHRGADGRAHALARDPAGTLWLVGDNRTAMRHSAGGWVRVPPATTDSAAYFALAFEDAGLGWIASSGGKLRRLSETEVVDEPVLGLSAVALHGIAMTAFGPVAVGEQGAVVLRSAAGTFYAVRADAGAPRLNAVAAHGDEAVAVGEALWRIAADGGVTAIPSDAGVLQSVRPGSPGELFAGGAGVIVRFGNGGILERWIVGTRDVHAITGTWPQLFAVAEGGAVFELTDAGWSVIASFNGVEQLEALDVTADSIHVAGDRMLDMLVRQWSR